jgi:hypothetical protein
MDEDEAHERLAAWARERGIEPRRGASDGSGG